MYMLGTFQVGEVEVAQKKARKHKEKHDEGSKRQPENVSIVNEYCLMFSD
jgi:hypothetical protein